MQLGYQLVREQLFFRQELIERVYWFIHLRWIAAGAGLVSTWAAYLFIEPAFPIIPVHVVLLSVILYNILFHAVHSRVLAHRLLDVRPFNVFAHTQICLDLLALFFLIYFTGGITSPLLIFVIFHIILAGILLSPLSCFIYSLLVLAAAAVLTIFQYLFPAQPVLFHSLTFLHPPDFQRILLLYLVFAAVILITAFLVTTLKQSLRTKGRELLHVSKELDESNTKLTALYAMVREMGLCTDLQALMDSATRNAAKIMGVKGCSIKLLDEQRRNLRFASTFGLSQDYLAKGIIEIEKSPINRKIIEGSAYTIGKIQEKDYFQYPEDIEKDGIASMMCLPLRVQKMVLGVFCVYSGVSYYFVEKDATFFSLMSDLTALSIEKMKSELNKTWFLQKASHQLRSPSNAISSMLKTIRKGYMGPITTKQEETIERCEKRIEILGCLIKDLLELAVKRAAMHRIEMHPVDSAKIMKTVMALYQVQASEKDIEISFHIGDSLAPIPAEEKLLDDLFSNLLSNAIKYTKPGGRVRVSLEREGQDRVLFTVADTGIGIPEKEMPQLFSEFFRAENAKAYVEEGTGLGLVIVKEILDRLRGTISVKSKQDQGTTFTCLLPS